MAAPASAYFNNGNTKMPAHKAGTAKYDLLLGIYMVDYNTDSLSKSIFYLDYLFKVAKKNADNSVSYTFIGGCLAGGSNIKMHNLTTRKSPVRLARKKSNGSLETVILFNDAGLNTLAKSLMIEPADSTFTNFTILTTFKSAFYSPTTDYFIEVRKADASTPWTKYVTVAGTPPPIPERAEQGKEFALGITDEITTWEVRATAVNEEGTYLSPSVFITTSLKPIQLRGPFSTASQAATSTGALTTFYIDDYSVISMDTKMHTTPTGKDASGNGAYPLGGYYNNGTANQYYRVQDLGLITESGTVTPNPASTTYIWVNYTTSTNSAGRSTACGTGTNGRTTYKKHADGLHYNEAACTTLAAVGSYSRNDDEYGRIVTVLTSAGTEGTTYSCTTGNPIL
jgi:hypothetical protein